MVVERSGGCGPAALKGIRKSANVSAAKSGLDPGVVTIQFLEGLCAAIRRTAARGVLNRGGSGPDGAPPLQLQPQDLLAGAAVDSGVDLA